ncbi:MULTISPECIES: sensor histidine kinase [Bacillus]|uniref:sensor histidine kinase n=1 Tax=Bacillus TaxID=1386 RepID=UPI0005D40070|nr:GHKL domain-containing protein [Bacillus altitudinis]KQL40900.1 histidine kinase [Bacillus sp. FJAT-21955]KJF47215.1 histidine kinase [Bacillus altitudinis]MBU8653119.1 GHKL domain-containing protein [Bacillus altitudinis]MBU8778456.1 GHKL domain-containing protein [Bacillus altitudinis]MCL6797976.1 GHKL domain-containing protein [Bacillus altitudinis]
MNAFYLGFRIYTLIWLGLAVQAAAKAVLPLSSSMVWLLTFCIMCLYTFFIYKRFWLGMSGYVILGAFVLITCSGISLFLTHGNGLSHLLTVIIILTADLLSFKVMQTEQRLNGRLQELIHAESRTNDLLLELRSKHHETARHLNAFSASNDEHEIKDLIQQYVKHFPWIKGENAYLASTLHSFFQRAEKEEIALSLDLQAPFSSLPFSKADQVSFTGNLLDNALDAAIEAKQAGNEGSISITTSIRSGLFLIHCENSTKGMEKHVLDHLFKTFGRSTKGGDHQGMGTYIIHQLVEKADGTLDFTYRSPNLRLMIKIPLTMA